MANILVLNGAIPLPLEEGWNLRVLNLSRALARSHRIFLATFQRGVEHLNTLNAMGVFEEITILRPNQESPSPRRLLRLSNLNYYKLGFPRYHERVTSQLREIVFRHKIELVIVGRLNESEFAIPLENVHKIVDDFDCQTLTLEREYAVSRQQMRAIERLRYKLDYWRCRNQESKLTNYFDLITTISKADQQQLQDLNVYPEHIVIVPNGVNATFLSSGPTVREEENAIAFWGNLSFPPNSSAIRHFYEEIYGPYLRSHNVRWYIIGRDADSYIRELASNNENIVVTGFIDDLKSFVHKIPVVINPMVMGSGLKNKVLEAFALKRAVVSTRLGMEAIDNAQPGTHYLEADSTAFFAEAVLSLLSNRKLRESIGINASNLVRENYSWETVGEQWTRLMESVIAANSRRSR